MNSSYDITDLDTLVSLYSKPHPAAVNKMCTELDEAMSEFIAQSPLLILSTLSAEGQLDCSPKGDAPGFVAIEDKKTLLIPDRPGNNLIESFRNLVVNKQIGLFFIVPKLRETLRIKGVATLSNDPELLQRFSVRGKPARLCTKVKIESVYFHCGKAMIRSNMWKPEEWASPSSSPIVKQGAKKMPHLENAEEKVSEFLENSYRDDLY